MDFNTPIMSMQTFARLDSAITEVLFQYPYHEYIIHIKWR